MGFLDVWLKTGPNWTKKNTLPASHKWQKKKRKRKQKKRKKPTANSLPKNLST